MTERFNDSFHPFVIPFLAGMAFVITVCLIKAVVVVFQMESNERRRYLLSLLKPNIIVKNIYDIIVDCLLHVRLWKRNRMLGFMHSSIAFGWFMIILLGHIQVLLYCPDRISTFYYPIFFDWFIEGGQHTLISILLDLFLYVILAGIALAIVKRFYSRLFGMRRTTRPTLLNIIGLYSLWAIFPLRFIAEQCARSGNLTLAPWWAYSIALCVFMCVLPFSRYLHIPAEMMLVTMRNAHISISRPGKGIARVQTDSCPNCGVCIDACPMNADPANLKDSTVYLTRQIRRHNDRRVGQISDKCMLCGKCTSVCQVGVDGPKLRILARAARKYNIGPDFSNVRPDVPKSSGKILYFGGCMSQLTPLIGRSIESVLKKSGVEYEWMDRDGGLCCGRPLHTAGRLKEARELVLSNQEAILASGAHTLLVSCPICYREFKERYVLPGISVVHYADFMIELIQSGSIGLKEKSDICYVYHDPCELGRGCGMYETPRRLIAQAAGIAEAPKNRTESVCCGGSLGSLSLDFAHREKITRASLQNLYDSGADAIATACPLCQATFSRYSDRPVKDLAQIIDEQTVAVIDSSRRRETGCDIEGATLAKIGN